jgi:hypothetical protein
MIRRLTPRRGVNRTSSEPPSHRDCAEFAVRACPFLTQQELERRTSALPEEITKAPGLGIAHNPGVALLWITKSYRLWRVPDDAVREAGATPGVLFVLGEPLVIEGYRDGRDATREDISAALERGLPSLRETARSQGPRAVAALVEQLQAFERLLEQHLGGLVHAPNRAVSAE